MARGATRLRHEVCGGSILQHIDETHALRHSGGVIWCVKCGGYTSRWPRSLLLPCRGKPWSASRRNVLRRLLLGLPPTPADHLQQTILEGGAPAGVPDYAGEAMWRSGVPIKGDARPLNPESMHTQLTEGNRGKAAVPPRGVYSRLPANRCETTCTPTDDARTNPTATTSATLTPVRTGASRTSRTHHCDGIGAWSSRVRASANRHRDACHLCSDLTSTCCRGCGARLCMKCARGKQACGHRKQIGDGSSTLGQRNSASPKRVADEAGHGAGESGSGSDEAHRDARCDEAAQRKVGEDQHRPARADLLRTLAAGADLNHQSLNCFDSQSRGGQARDPSDDSCGPSPIGLNLSSPVQPEDRGRPRDAICDDARTNDSMYHRRLRLIQELSRPRASLQLAEPSDSCFKQRRAPEAQRRGQTPSSLCGFGRCAELGCDFRSSDQSHRHGPSKKKQLSLPVSASRLAIKADGRCFKHDRALQRRRTEPADAQRSR